MLQKRLAKPTLSVLAGAVLLACANLALAGQPDAGTLMQETQPMLPAQPSQEGLVIPDSDVTGVQDNTPFQVTKITIDGNQAIDTATLYDLVKSYEGGTHTISDLQKAAKKITHYYRAQGYSFSRAVLPQQEIKDGVVRIQVIEARYGSVNLQENKSRVSDSLIQSTISPLLTGADVKRAELDRSLLLLSDIVGAEPNAVISPGAELGQSDLDINIAPTQMITGSLNVDNFGNRYINRGRVAGTVNIYNPLKHGDTLSINLLTTGKRMQYGQISYDWLLNGAGTHIGAAYSGLHYELGKELESLDIHGSAQTGELWVKHPLIRSQNNNLYGEVRYQHNKIRDDVDVSNTKNHRTLDAMLLSLNGDFKDKWLEGGINSYSISYTTGDLDFDNTAAQTLDAAAANTQGHFSKWNFNFNSLHDIGSRTQIWASITGQFAQDNLDSSEKMVFGGPYSVRAYDNGALSADNGYLATVELRHILGRFHGVWQGVLFADTAGAEVNKDKWATFTGKNKAHLSGVGAGVNWYGANDRQGRLFLAKSVGGSNILTEDADRTIAWIEFSQLF